MKRHYLYVTTCHVNNKKYVGQHITRCQTKKDMLNDKYYGSGTILLSAIKKYGKDKFTKEIIHICDSQKEIDKFEIGYISYHDVLDNPSEWYNRSGGGQFDRAENHSKYISKKMKEVWGRKEYRDKLRETLDSDEYRITHGKRTKGEIESENIQRKYNNLIRVMRIIRNKKIKEENILIAKQNGYSTYQEYKRSVYEDTDKRKMARKWGKTPIGRFTMSWKKKGKGSYSNTTGYGKYNNKAFNNIINELNITNNVASNYLSCHSSTIRHMRKGYRTSCGIKKEVQVKDIYYEKFLLLLKNKDKIKHEWTKEDEKINMGYLNICGVVNKEQMVLNIVHK